MSFVATAIGGSAALGVGSSVLGGIFGNKAAKEQAAGHRYAADKAAATALEMNNRARADVAPFREFGINAGNTLWNLLNAGSGKRASDFVRASPLFDFQSELGSRNINRELSARGMYESGAGLETLARFNNQLVAEEGNRLFDRLFNLTGMGANAAAGMAAGTNNAGSVMANAQLNGYSAAAGSEADATRAVGGAAQGGMGAVAGALNTGANYSMIAPLLQRISGGSGGVGEPTYRTQAGKRYSFTGETGLEGLSNFN